MIYLTVPPNEKRRPTYLANLLGVMATPNMGTRASLLGDVICWAADNGCFTKGDEFDLLNYYEWLNDRRPYSLTCLFATAPDVVGDAEATWARSSPVLHALRVLGYRAALVGQDGVENHRASWDEHEAWDTFFLGGSTEWKLSMEALDCTKQAISLGKPVHMGRVNSYKRLALADAWGCESADGTYVGFAPDVNLPKVCEWLRRLHSELTLEGV